MKTAFQKWGEETTLIKKNSRKIPGHYFDFQQTNYVEPTATLSMQLLNPVTITLESPVLNAGQGDCKLFWYRTAEETAL